MAPECHFENFVESIGSPVSSSGEGCPGALISQEIGAFVIWGEEECGLIPGFRPKTRDLRLGR